MTSTYTITGGDHGNYRIFKNNEGLPWAFVRLNAQGGGYTVTRDDKSGEASFRNMPACDTSEEQAQIIAAMVGGGV